MITRVIALPETLDAFLDQPAFRWTHLNADKLIYFKDLEHPASVRTQDALGDQAKARGFASTEDYVRDLIERERDRETLRSALLAGAGSPQIGEGDGQYIEGLRKRVHVTAGAGRRSSSDT